MQMDGLGNYGGWRWIFIIEGILTVLLGVFGWFLLIDFPEQATKAWRFLNDEEVKLVVDRINADRHDVEATPFNFKEYISYAGDWKIWVFGANIGLTSIVNYSASYFLPIILREGLGYSVAAAQCLNTPVCKHAILSTESC